MIVGTNPKTSSVLPVTNPPLVSRKTFRHALLSDGERTGGRKGKFLTFELLGRLLH